ncbi:MAG TPA: type 4a pilus biogenesis protein PilO [Vicinamibacterales bacterium]|jgi:type IV pilus assembly protein PilO
MDLSLNKLPWYAQVGMFAVLGLGGIAAFYYFYAAPMQAEMAEREKRLASLRADINKGMTTATKLTEFREEVSKLQGRLDNLKAVLPEQKDVADLLRRIQTLATQSNLTIRGFKPMGTSTKQLHAEWPIALQLDGTYHNLGMFFDRIGKFSRIINVSNIAIKTKTGADSGTISAECTATTFVLLDQKSGAAPPAKKS